VKNYWLSWYCPPHLMGKFELHWPWWISGLRVDDEHEVICAAVRAEDEEAAKRIIIDAHDEPRPVDLEWRFVAEKPDDWSPFDDRFQKANWMQWQAAEMPPRKANPTPLPPFCRAGRDGECTWKHCPQERDGEPMRSGRHCPIDAFSRLYCDEDGNWLSARHENDYRALLNLD